MQIKSKLKVAMLSSLLGMSSVTWAAQKIENVDVTVKNNKGHVTILKNIDGKQQKIEESFVTEDGTDIQDSINNIFEKHGIKNNHNSYEHHIRNSTSQHGKNMAWVQKNDDVNINLENGQATVIIKKDNNGELETIKQTIQVDADTDIDALVDELMIEHGIEIDDAEVHRKVIKIDKHFSKIDSDKPRMGFMANVQENGWEIVSVVPDSGAAEAGIQKGDVVISIDGQSTTEGGLGLTEFIAMDKEVGDISEVMILRDNKQFPLNVASKVIDSPDIVMKMSNGNKLFSSSGNDFKFATGDLNSLFDGLHVDIDHLDKIVKDFGDHQIRVVTTGDADAYFFSGSKMNQWLGKNHHFSTITQALGQYFGTAKGVLVLEVDQNNKLGLKDGDVIQAINGEDVESPKDVVRIMSGFKSNESFEIEIIRKKETLYLES